MATLPMRTFTLWDVLVLIAATAIGLAWLRIVWDLDSFHDLEEWLRSAPEMSVPLLAAWTIGIGALRLLPPRPPMHRLVLQPGAAACGAVMLVFTTKSLLHVADLFARGPNGVQVFDVAPRWYSLVLSETEYHYPIAVVWALLLLSRRCRPEPSWIDRAGRGLGLSWLVLALWYAVDRAMHE
jgi:hypothetical protein